MFCGFELPTPPLLGFVCWDNLCLGGFFCDFGKLWGGLGKHFGSQKVAKMASQFDQQKISVFSIALGNGTRRRRAATGGAGRRRTATGGDGRRRAATGGDGRQRAATSGDGRRQAATDGDERRQGNRGPFVFKSSSRTCFF